MPLTPTHTVHYLFFCLWHYLLAWCICFGCYVIVHSVCCLCEHLVCLNPMICHNVSEVLTGNICDWSVYLQHTLWFVSPLNRASNAGCIGWCSGNASKQKTLILIFVMKYVHRRNAVIHSVLRHIHTLL